MHTLRINLIITLSVLSRIARVNIWTASTQYSAVSWVEWKL
jgi:hypothetical protein